ncbi:ATP-binding protein [Solidesulfovibrio carbinolicus]|uniref:histidine kinase n=1 Tax=Solidesulfovibrio carbinolicus TaxID=296842 RepID=A0A4P6HH06_9BACT|nr:ATP-binding protein [Solidesulfovibrio carbinolicus]QAZ66401.1 PAS domain-containing sensor histidine kinase [Solidesulfovibrio carbinolicus]
MIRSIKTQVLMGQLALVALLTLFLGGGMFHLATSILEREEQEKMRLVAAGLARETALAITQGENRLRLLAGARELDRFAAVRDYHILQALFGQHRFAFATIAFINAHGVQEYAATRTGFTDALSPAGDTALAADAMAAPGTVVTALRLSADGRDAWLALAQARLDAFGVPLGVFLVTLPLSELTAPLRSLHLEHGGVAGLAHDGGLLLPSDGEDGALSRTPLPETVAKLLVLGGERAATGDFAGQPNILGTASVGLHGLSVVVAAPLHRIVDETTTELGLWTAAVAAASAFLAFLASYWWTRGLTRPLARLGQAARAIAHGNLSVRAPVAGPAETRELAVAFNAMAEGLIASREGLAQAKQSLERILSHVNEALWVIDREGRVRLCNRAGSDMLGYAPEELVGRPATSLFPPGDPLGTFLTTAPVTELLASGGMTGLEKTLCGKDGRTLSVLVSLALLRGQEAGEEGVVCLAMDVTERKRADDLTRARKAAEAVSRAKTEFLAVLSHELRTPLNIMLGMLEHAQGCELPAPTQAGLVQAVKSGQTMLEVIAAMLDYASLEANRVVLRRQPFSPGLVAMEVAGRFTDVAKAKGVTLAVDISPDLPATLIGDAARLTQALANLMSNAVRFTMGGEARLFLGGRLTSGPDGERWGLLAMVSDTGMGVTDAKLEYIFEPFTQEDASASRRFGGLGLGLAIARRLVGLMGGGICMDSRPGQGTDVYLTVPLELDE